jgi:demethylmenaquinone methyltransferase/2-methoxy-6-polyprenyl-1,4-benzoquinol methylase
MVNQDDKAKYIHRMFSCIAGRYDFLNTLLSLNRDKAWRRFAVAKSGLKPGGTAIDVATGTGKLAIELAKVVGPKGRVVGVDFSEKMLDRARINIANTGYKEVIELVIERAENLPFSDNTFDCATIGFALRNVTDIKKTLEEMKRVVKPSGRVISLEFTQPKNWLFRKIYYFYFFKILPFVGGIISGKREAYTYLPNSVVNFPSQEKLKEIMEGTGLKDIKIYILTGGIVAVHVGTK